MSLTGFADETGLIREVSYDSPLPVSTSYSGRLATKTVTYSALTTGATGAHTLFTVKGSVFAKIFAVCSADLTSAGAATNEVGTAGNTAALIAQTTATAIDNGEIWYNNTPVAEVVATSNFTEKLVVSDIIETIATDTITGGTVTYYCLWSPIGTGSLT